MKIFNIAFAILFMVAAALQYNDPDPYLWIPIYLYAAYLSYRASKEQYNRALYLVGLVVFGVYAGYLFVDKSGVLNWAEEHHAESLVHSMKATKPWIEETREFFGLLIVVIVMLVNMAWLGRKRKP